MEPRERELYSNEEDYCSELCRAHKAWELARPPDIVTFAKKMLTGGFYSRREMRPREVGSSYIGDWVCESWISSEPVQMVKKF